MAMRAPGESYQSVEPVVTAEQTIQDIFRVGKVSIMGSEGYGDAEGKLDEVYRKLGRVPEYDSDCYAEELQELKRVAYRSALANTLKKEMGGIDDYIERPEQALKHIEEVKSNIDYLLEQEGDVIGTELDANHYVERLQRIALRNVIQSFAGQAIQMGNLGYRTERERMIIEEEIANKKEFAMKSTLILWMHPEEVEDLFYVTVRSHWDVMREKYKISSLERAVEGTKSWLAPWFSKRVRKNRKSLLRGIPL